MTLHDVLNPGVEGEHKFPPHSGKQMIFSSSNQFNGSSFRGSGSSRESGCTGGGGGSIAVQVKGGDHGDQLIITNIDFRNDHDDHEEKISGSPLCLLINLSLYIGSGIIGL